ncbi:MAG: phosphoribosylformylglycinamidine synthase subunit PurL [Acidilobaceae archaeon]
MPLSNSEIEEIKKLLGREPTIEELAMFEAQWSEHCSYKSSRLLLKLLPTEDKHVVVGPGRDAPAVEVFPGVLVVFKIESHNHPSAVDPYNGAATGIGGVVRDVLTLGAKPIALLDLLYLGEPQDSHSLWLIRGIVKGISDYGNRIGVPTVAGDTFFDRSFNRQPLVNVGCVGVLPKSRLLNDSPKPGDFIVIAGNATGRDGLLGSSFASKPLEEDVDKDIGAVQVGDPLTEKLLIDAILHLTERGLIRYVKDLGGGGLTTAVSEVAAEHGLGASIYLDRLHTRQKLTPLELLVSESQERMLLVVEPSKLSEVLKVLEIYDLRYSVLGYFDDTGKIKAYFGERLVADVPAKELAKPRAIRRESLPPQEALKGLTPITKLPELDDLAKAALKVLSSPNIASKRWIFEQYDHEVGARTVVKPGYADAAVLALDERGRGIAIKGDANPRYTYLDPFNGAANSVAECFRNLSAVGSKPLAIVDELNAGNPEIPEQYWYFEMMAKGVAWMSKELGLPVVGGKVSFYNTDHTGKQVKPTTTIIGIGRVENVDHVVTMDFKEEGSYIVVVGTTYPELGGSEYLHVMYGLEIGEIPKPRPVSETKNSLLVRSAIKKGLVLAAHDISSGGLAAALLEMAVLGGIAFKIDLAKAPSKGIMRLDELLFSETQARYVLEVRQDKIGRLKKLAERLGVDVEVIGRTVGNGKIMFEHEGKEVFSLDLGDARVAYESLENVLEV